MMVSYPVDNKKKGRVTNEIFQILLVQIDC